MNLTDLLSGSVISSIAGQTGTSEKDTRNVLANALPALVGAMAQNASTEEGAESLARALDDHTTAEGLSGLLGKVDTEDGAKILTKILGGRNDAVQKAVAKKSGASKTDTTKILTMAAPLLLAALGSQKKKTKTKSAGLGSLLTGLLGGGEDDEDDGSTLVSLAGSLLGGAKPWYYPLTKEHGFLPYVKDIPEDVARRAKYMIVSLPANPVGSVGTPELYAELVAFAKKYDILIIHDNAYSDIIFDGAVGNSFFNTPGAMDVGVEFFSLSKSFNVTGARISFLVGRRAVVAAFKKLRGQIDFGMFLPVQKAAIAALTGPLDMVKTQCGLYQQRRDALCGGLRSIGWDVPASHGSMFVWAPIPEKYAKSMDFCLDLVEKSGVLCTPGSSFGPLGEGYVRFALTLPPERIADAIKSIKESGILD